MAFPNPSTQFQSGDGWKGNARGRPKGDSLTKLLRDALDADSGDGDGRTRGHEFIEAMIRRALAGDAAVIKEIFNRMDGKVPAKVEQGDYTISVEYLEARDARMNAMIEKIYGDGAIETEVKAIDAS